MFTGIIEEVGQVISIRSGPRGGILAVRGKSVTSDAKLGDSIAVNGVCLTVTGLTGSGFSADVMKETLNRSTLGSLKPGTRVNLERAMAADGRFGGHVVSGHIDGVGRIAGMRREGNAKWFQIQPPENLMKYLAEKGSVAIDGISLTIAKREKESFWVSIIPLTRSETILGERGLGDRVNLEIDPLARYLDQLDGERDLGLVGKSGHQNKNKGLTRFFLESHGYGRR
jgi:riboflavin synthase